jgi:hypothetical protein
MGLLDIQVSSAIVVRLSTWCESTSAHSITENGYPPEGLAVQKKGVTDFSTTIPRDFLGDVDYHHFFPSPSVINIKYVAMGKRRWLPGDKAVGDLVPRQGWLVTYD